MSRYIANSLTNLLELFTSHTHKPSALRGADDVEQMLEHVVDVVDPRIRVIGRYAQKLTQPLSHTWDYLNDLANDIPGGMTFSRAAFSSDPRMKLLFESQGVLSQLLDTVIPLIQDHGDTADSTHKDVYMLLCMEKKEHSFLGAELAGDIIKRDVMQTKVTFTNRKFLSAGFGEEDAKLGFKHCALEGLLHQAHGLILQSRTEQKQLIERKKQLYQQLHTAHDSQRRQQSILFSRNDHLINAHPELQELERQLTEIRIKSESPDHHLSQVIDVLNHPEQYLKLERQSILLSNLGIKLTGDALEHGVNIEYAEVEIEQSLKRATSIVSCSAEEIFSHPVH
ncbi:hypothetical protein [Kaarinaea lacus]